MFCCLLFVCFSLLLVVVISKKILLFRRVFLSIQNKQLIFLLLHHVVLIIQIFAPLLLPLRFLLVKELLSIILFLLLMFLNYIKLQSKEWIQVKEEGEEGGPTILDINTGFIRTTHHLENLFLTENTIYSKEDFEIYGNIIRHLKNLVSITFNISNYFTTPTFITRLNGDPTWEPSGWYSSLSFNSN